MCIDLPPTPDPCCTSVIGTVQSSSLPQQDLHCAGCAVMCHLIGCATTACPHSSRELPPECLSESVCGRRHFCVHPRKALCTALSKGGDPILQAGDGRDSLHDQGLNLARPCHSQLLPQPTTTSVALVAPLNSSGPPESPWHVSRCRAGEPAHIIVLFQSILG